MPNLMQGIESKQLNIFDVIRDTQREAWESVKDKIGDRHLKVMDAIRREPLAGFEVARALGWQLYRTLPRITELAKLGALEDSGIRRINPDSGKRVIVWKLAMSLREAA